MNYYIADLHFGHRNIISLCNRPFVDVNEMEQILIKNWNDVVKNNDNVYIVGDLFFKHQNIESILSSLNGKKHLILGNHDTDWINDELISKYFVSCDKMLEIVDNNHRIMLCHYPMLSYPKQSRTYMIHGHIHNDTLFDYWHVLVKRKNVLNAGVEINNFKPVSLTTLIENNTKYKATILDSYPHTLLSVRFNQHYCNENSINTKSILNELNNYLESIGIIYLKEGLYKLTNVNQINQIKDYCVLIQNDEKSSLIYKNFDLVAEDETGCFSYSLKLK